MKKLFLTLTIFILSISFYPVKAMEKTADILKKNVVTSGDGLYVDSTIDGRYIYRGGNPNNYIRLGDDLYRIISLEKDGTIKVIKQDSIRMLPWDEAGARYSTNSDDFCTSASGCKSWGSNTTTLDTNGNNVIQMPLEVNGTLKNLPEKEASLNTYLNNDFYNGLSDDVKSLVVERTWNVGPTAYNQTNLSESIKEESAYKWKGKVALMNATDYVKSSTNSECKSVYAYQKNSSCYNNSKTHNYLYSNNDPWTVSPYAFRADIVFNARSGGDLRHDLAYYACGVRPALYLSAKTTLSGEGSEADPYKVSKYIEEVKEEPKDEENNNTNNEVKVDNGQIVEVPSTSAFGSIIIAGLGIACVTGSAVIMGKTTRRREK